ncbi:MAG TPA: ABC transporter permease [Gaiellaceae bacterium]|jgi:ABC-type dipeptide/oligopeptide/nickel transport system permease subunit
MSETPADIAVSPNAMTVGEAVELPPRGRRLRLASFLLRRDPLACALVLVFLLAATIGPFLAPYPPNAPDLEATLQGPSAAHLLGTDQFGRDILSRLLTASRVAAEAVLIVILIGGVIGTLLGSLAGLFGGAIDAIVSRMIEIVQGFPIVLLAIAVVAVAGPSLLNAMIAVAVGAIPDFARVARSVAIQLRTREFVEAARSVGASEPRILTTEILPNMVGALVVIATFDGAQAVMYEAALSFLGLGVQPPEASFGGMLSEAKEYLALDAWYAFVCGVALAAVILGLNLLGDALSDYFQRTGRR